MDAFTSQLETLLELDARHDDLLERLEELDRRVEQVLADCLPGTSGQREESQRSVPPVEAS